MSTPAETVSTPGSIATPDSSGRFSTFFRKFHRTPSGSDVGSDEALPKKTRSSRIFKSGKTMAAAAPASDEPQTAAQRRRQQVYQAQKRHRDRNAEYVRNLESEVARFQQLDAQMSSEKNALAHQNNAIRDLLAKQSVDAQFDLMDLSSQSGDDLSQFGAGTMDIRFDSDMGQDRWFLDLPELSFSPSDPSTTAATPSKHLSPGPPIAGDSWAALDFILALEWPCRSHIHHQAFNPEPVITEACSQGNFHGHALTATKAIFESSLAPPEGLKNGDGGFHGPGLDPRSAENWLLPHSEIDKLVELAQMLEIDDEFVTPAQAYAATRATVPNEKYLRPVLQALKAPLSKIVNCLGFGAGMDAGLFWQTLESTIVDITAARLDLD